MHSFLNRLNLKWSIAICVVFILMGCAITDTKITSDKHAFGPADYYYLTLAYPSESFPVDAYKKAMQTVSDSVKNAAYDFRGGGSEWILEGPVNISGRMNTIAIHPDSSNIMLVGLASGGIFKTIDNGLNWYPVFDEFAFLAIGHIVYDPANTSVVYAGTGDPNISGYPFIGDGIYKSTNGGESWTYIGLSETAIISKLIVHPADNNIIYAAAMGLPFERNEDRGLYKSTDAGVSWNKILYVDDDAGIIDIVSDPDNADIIYAASWNRIRNNHESLVAGTDAKIWKSTDGGVNWIALTDGLPGSSQSRISIEMRADNANVLYACYVSTGLSMQGIYKTTDGGDNWNEINTAPVDDIFSGFGWYFDGIALNPFNNDLFVLGVGMVRTSDDGGDWDDLDDWNVHADKHAMHFISSNNYLLATDGGLYRTTNNGNTWSDIENIPSAQFYHIDINPHEDVYWGGMQDNGTSKGNADGIDTWVDVYGGDGFHSEFRPDDPDVYYVEYQNGGIVGYNGSYFSATSGISSSDRRSWNMPYLISKYNPDILYAGTYRIYKSTSGVYPSFTTISSDLTDGLIYSSAFHTITTIAESNFEPGVLFAGTVDANVWRTLDDGSTWTNITADLPQQYVTDIIVSHQDTQRIFVSHSGYKENDFIPHIHRSDNYGDTWVDISGNLPQLAINAMAVHPATDNYIFVATDGGVYFTINGGVVWERLGNNMPVIPVYDIEFDSANNKLIAGTHARSVWSMAMEGILPPLVYASDDIEICSGETATLFVSGAEFYEWTPDTGVPCDYPCAFYDVSPLVNTTYIVTGTDAYGLSNTDTVNVVVHTAPIASIIETGTFLIASVDETYSYQWFIDGILISGAVDDSLSYDPANTAIYSVIITNVFGCSDTAEISLIGVSVNNLDADIFLSPNPAYENVTLEFVGVTYPARCSLFDMTGAFVKEILIPEPKVEISLAGLPVGTYLLQYELNNKTRVHTFQKL